MRQGVALWFGGFSEVLTAAKYRGSLSMAYDLNPESAEQTEGGRKKNLVATSEDEEFSQYLHCLKGDTDLGARSEAWLASSAEGLEKRYVADFFLEAGNIAVSYRWPWRGRAETVE